MVEQVSMGVAGEVMGWCGLVLALLMFVQPMMQMRQVISWKDTRGFSAFPYSSAALQCFMWVLYSAVLPNRMQALLTNLIGFVLFYSYLLIFSRYANAATRRAIHAQAAGLPLLLLAITAGCIQAARGLDDVVAACAGAPAVERCMAERRAEYTLFPLPAAVAYRAIELFGALLLALNIVFYASPLAVVRDVVRTRSVDFLPLPFSLILTLCAAAWCVFGLALGDLTVLVPNVCGVALGLVQIGVWAYCRKPATPVVAAVAAILETDAGAPCAPPAAAEEVAASLV